MNRICLFLLFVLIFLLSNGALFSQDSKPLETPAKEKTLDDKNAEFDELSTNEFLNGKSNDPNQKNKPLFNPTEKARVSVGSYLQMFVVLAFILFLIYLFFYFSKNKLRKNLLGMNGIEVLAKASILPKQTILLVRIGPRVLVLNAAADGNIRTLSEFTNQEEIDSLLSEINKSSRDNIFQSLLTRNQVLYDEESTKEEKILSKIDKETDKLQGQ